MGQSVEGGRLLSREHVSEYDTKVIALLHERNSIGISGHQLNKLEAQRQKLAEVRAARAKLQAAFAEDSSLIEVAKFELILDDFTRAEFEIETSIEELLQETARLYAQMLADRDNEYRALHPPLIELPLIVRKLWRTDDVFCSVALQYKIRNSTAFLEALKSKSVPSVVLEAFLAADRERFAHEQVEMREVVKPMIDEFLTEVFTSRAARYVDTPPDIIRRRIERIAVNLIDDLDPRSGDRDGHFNGSEIGISRNTYLDAAVSPRSRERLRRTIFHELTHAIDGVNIVKTVTYPAREEVGILPQTELRLRRSGVGLSGLSSELLNEARVELLAAFLGRFDPDAYPVERFVFWEMIDAGVSLDAVYQAASGNIDVYAPAGSKAPAFGRLAREMSTVFEGPGMMKAFERRVKMIQENPEQFPEAYEGNRSLPE